VRVALIADHVITAVSFLARCGTAWTSRSVQADVIVRRLFFGGEFSGRTRQTIDVFAVPRSLADAAEGVLAFRTDTL